MGVYFWQDWYYEESIVYKMNADSSWNLYVPASWISTSWSFWPNYSWKISVDGWTETTYTWNSSSWKKITLSWYTAWSNHTIQIRPTTEWYWWARAYGRVNTSCASYLTEILYDGSYMWFATSATATWNYFRYYLYSWCSSITYSPEEVLPDTVTSIGTYFRVRQFENCTSLTEIKWWKDLSIWNGTQYRNLQYYWCTAMKTVKVLSDVGYSSYGSWTNGALNNAYVTSVSVPSAYLSNFKNTSNQPRAWIDDSKFVWY